MSSGLSRNIVYMNKIRSDRVRHPRQRDFQMNADKHAHTTTYHAYAHEQIHAHDTHTHAPEHIHMPISYINMDTICGHMYTGKYILYTHIHQNNCNLLYRIKKI